MRISTAFLFCVSSLAIFAVGSPASAETLTSALASAYGFNPEINSARAGTRAVDEGVPLAKSFMRPTVGADFSVVARNVSGDGTSEGTTTTGTAAVSIDQFIFRGFRTKNAIREAEADVRASRELQRNTVQNILFDAAQAYMNVLRDAAILNIRRQNVEFLSEQVRAATDRFNVGETTRTDVAQADAARALGLSGVSVAEANLNSSRAVYRQVVGREPRGLRPGTVPAGLIPNTLESALATAQADHPAILAAVFQADSEGFAVKQVEGELLPTVSVSGTLERDLEISNSTAFSNGDSTTATIVGRVSVPIYQGGAVAARVRQAKELYGQRKIEIDLNRDQVRAAVVSAWGQLESSVGTIAAARSQVEAQRLALSGVQEEQAVGQRTTLDVLDAQQDLLNAQTNLIIAERDRIVAAYALLSAIGRLTPEDLGLPVAAYRPEHHYEAVKDKWYGLRTPDGR